MNHECHGVLFKSLGFYRCLKDGELVEADEMPSVCPNCGRECRGRTAETSKVRTVVRQEFQYIDGSWLVWHQEIADERDVRAIQKVN